MFKAFNLIGVYINIIHYLTKRMSFYLKKLINFFIYGFGFKQNFFYLNFC